MLDHWLVIKQIAIKAIYNLMTSHFFKNSLSLCCLSSSKLLPFYLGHTARYLQLCFTILTVTTSTKLKLKININLHGGLTIEEWIEQCLSPWEKTCLLAVSVSARSQLHRFVWAAVLNASLRTLCDDLWQKNLINWQITQVLRSNVLQ